MNKQLFLFCLLVSSWSLQAQTPSAPSIRVYFSPNGGCTEAVVDSIQQAKKSVLVEAYSFTSRPIANALIDAEHRGVDVEVILDKSRDRDRGSDTALLSQSGVPTFLDAAYKIDHNKFMLFDGTKVITGSFNFTRNAEKYNAENMLVISNDPELTLSYTTTWKEHLAKSKQYHPSKNHPLQSQFPNFVPPFAAY